MIGELRISNSLKFKNDSVIKVIYSLMNFNQSYRVATIGVINLPVDLECTMKVNCKRKTV